MKGFQFPVWKFSLKAGWLLFKSMYFEISISKLDQLVC